jgi:hypothetical protein
MFFGNPCKYFESNLSGNHNSTFQVIFQFENDEQFHFKVLLNFFKK